MEQKISTRILLQTTRRAIGDIFRAAPKESTALLVLMITTGLLPFASTYLFSLVIDTVVAITSTGQALSKELITFIALYATIEIFQNITWAVFSYMDREQFFALGRFFTFNFLRKASELDMYHYENSKQNDLISRARDAYSWRPQNLGSRITWTVDGLVRTLASIGIIAIFSPIFLMIIIITVLPTLIVILTQSDIEFGVWGDTSENRRRYYEGAHYLADEQSLMELRIFRTKNYILEMVRSLYDSFNIKQRQIASRRAFLESFASIFSKLGIIGFWIYVIDQTLAGHTSIGELTFYTSTAFAFSNSLAALFRNIASSYEDVKYMSDYYAFQDLENKIKPGQSQLAKLSQPPRIEFKNVDFSYPDSTEPVLTNFNLEINPGERIALVGENGAGKSTIIKLLSRFYDPTAGAILINGQDLRELDTDSWYNQLGVLFQNFVKYESFDAATNIAVGNIDNISDMDRIKQSASQAGADKFITELKKGYEQVLSKHFPEGTDLSGGQWQKLALARGFFRDAPILILDEPTSAIDAKAEAAIFEKLYEFAGNKTVIIISHRFSTVRQADTIYVVDKGAIVEKGTHAELVQLNGKYKEAFDKQAEGYK